MLRAAFWVLVASKIIGGWGLAWDIQWHVTIGRDSFWIPPHVMIYASVVLAAVVGAGILVLETRGALGGARSCIRVLGLRGTPGFHLATWGMGIVTLAAPVDDLWHRLFGLDVTLWSPPHLLGLLGAAINTIGCVVIATEVYERGSRARVLGVVLAGALLYGGIRVLLDPAYLLAYNHGGVLFYAPAMFAVVFLPLTLVACAYLTERRWAPIAVLVLVIALGLSAEQISKAGFAIVKPVSVIDEEIKKDPTSPIAQANAITEKNRGARPTATMRLLALIPVALMVLVDARRRPVAATMAYAVGSFAFTSWYLMQRPAFQPLAPAFGETVVAVLVTGAAALAGAFAARWFAEWLGALRPEVRTATAATQRPASLPAASRTPA